MYIACTKNHGTDYLQVHEAYSVLENGKSKQKIRVVKNIGPLARFDDGKGDYLARLRQSFKTGKCLIPQLDELKSEEAKERKQLSVKFNRDFPSECICDVKNIGYFLLDGLYDSLGIGEVIDLHKSRSKIGYDLNGLTKLLIFERVLDPSSKQATWYDKSKYLFGITKSDNLIEIYRTLSVLDLKAGTIQKRMNLKIQAAIKRDKSICFYDVTKITTLKLTILIVTLLIVKARSL
jgi:hypothetical protein